MFGISAAAEIYHHTIQQVLQGLPGIKNISDDLFVFRKDQMEHDPLLHQVLTRLQERQLTLNSDKCKFNVPEITFFGFDISAAGCNTAKPSDHGSHPQRSNAKECLENSQFSGFGKSLQPFYTRFSHHWLPSNPQGRPMRMEKQASESFQ